MQEKLIVFVNTSDMTQPGWAVVAGDAVVKSNYRGFARQLVDEAKNRKVIVIVPGEDVTLTTVTLPKMSHSRLQQAIPYALEEQVIDDVEQMHFAAGEYIPDGKTPVAVIAKNKMREWTDWFKTINLEPDVVLPQMLALPTATGVWHVQVGDTAVVRTGSVSGFVCDRYNLKDMLQLALQSEQPNEIQLELCGDEKMILDLPVKIQQTHIEPEAMLDQLARYAGKEQPLNLLQGVYRNRKSSHLPKMTSVLRISSYVLAAWFLMLISYPVVSYVLLSQRMQHFRGEIAAIYKREFPHASSVVAPRQRMQQKLHKLTSSANDNPFLLLLANIGKGLNVASGVQLKRMDYQGGSMTIEISAASSSAFATFNDALSQQGLRVQQQNADLNGSRVNATLRIE